METDIRNMKRKELQALCKKHKILANLTNYEMANQLILIFKETKKPISKGKSCLRSAVEQASEDLSDSVNKLSKKVRFSPENETFEFQASETKQEDKGRGTRARKRSMIRRAEGIGGIVLEKNEDVVNNPARGTRSRAAKVAPNVESVPTVETRMRTRRTLEIVEVENIEHVKDDEVLKKNPAKRISRNKGVIIENKVSVTEKVGRRSKRNAKQFEDGEAPKQGLSGVQVVETGRSKRQRSKLVQNANVTEAASKSEIELQVVLQIEEPPVRSSRYGTRKQSMVPQAENARSGRAKDKTGNNTLVLGTAFDHNARSKRTSRKAVAVSDAIVAENPVDNQSKNRRRGRVSEEQKGIIKGSPLVEEPPRKSSRQANRRQSIMPLPKNTRAHGFKDENSKHRNRRGRVLEEQKDIIEGSPVVEEPPRKSSRQTNRRQSIKPKLKNTGTHGSEDKDENDKNTSKSSAVEENANTRRISSRRKSMLNSDKSPVRNVRKATSRRMDPVLEEDNAVIEEVSSLVKQSSRKSPRSSAKAQKSLALSDKTVEKSMELCEISQWENGVPQDNTNLEKVNSPKVIGLAETASGPAKLQNYHEETEGSIGVSGLSGIEIVLNIDTEDQVYKESVLENSNSGPEFDGESNVSKNGVLAEVSLGQIREFDQAAKQAKDVDSEKDLELNKNSELESQASGALAFTNEEEETRTEFGASGFYIELNIEKDAGVGIDKLSQEHTANEDDSDSDNLALVDSDGQSNSGFKMISDDDSETQEDEELPIEGRKSNDDDSIANSSSLLASEKPNEFEYVVCPGAALVEEGYPIDQSVCSGKSEEKINLQMDMDENTELGKHRESISAIFDNEDEVESSNDSEESHSAEVEVLDKSYREKNTPGELESIEKNELERSGMVDEVEIRDDTDENYSAEVEVLDKSYGEKNTPVEAKSIERNELESSVMVDAAETSIDSEENHSAELEVLDKSYGLKKTPGEVKSIERHGLERSGMVDEVETSIDSEENHSTEPGILDKSHGEKNTSGEVQTIDRHRLERSGIVNETLEYSTGKEQLSGEPKVNKEIIQNIQSPLAQPKGIRSMDNLGIASSEPEDSYVHISDRKEITPCKMKESVKDETKNHAIIEPKNGQELTDEFDVKGHSAQDSANVLNKSVLKENLEIVNEEIKDSSSPNTSGQNKSTAFEVEDNECDDVSALGSGLQDSSSTRETLVDALVLNKSSVFKAMSVDYAESIHRTPMSSRDNASSLKKQNHLSGVATPVFASNEIRSLMVINLDSTPASEFGKVLNDPMLQDHQVPSAFPTVESTEDLNDVLNENIVVTDCLSPLSKESNSEKHSSPTLFKDLHIENPESSVFEANQVSQEGHNSGEQSGKQGFEDDSSTQPVESEDRENELDADFNKLNSEIETQLLETTSPISGSAEYQGSLTESKDDDAINKGLFLGKNSATEKDNNTKSVIEGGLLGPTEYKDEDIQLIGSCVDTQCLEIEASPSALEASKSASEFVYSKQIPEEETEGTGMMVSEHGHGDLTANVMNSVEESGDMDEKTVENSASVGQADYSGNESGHGITHIRKELAYLESGGGAMKQGYSTSTALDTTGEEENEDFNIFEQSETQYDDGMFDGLLGYEMEMVPEPVHAEKLDSPCNPDQFSGDSQAALKDKSLEEDEIRIEGMPVRSNETPDECLVKSQNLTSRADGEDASHCYTSNIDDVTQCANELKEFAENQCWSPEPGLGNSQASYDSNMFGSWGYSISSQGEAEKSNYVVSKVSFAEEHESVAEEQVATVSVPQSSSAASRNAMLNEVYDLKGTEVQIFVEGGNIGDTGADVMVHEEVKRCEVSITEVCVLKGTESGCFLGETNDVEEVVAKISDPVIGDRQSEYANIAFHGGDAGTSLVGDDERLADLSIFPTKENNLEVHMRVSRDISLVTEIKNYQGEISEDAVGQIPSSEIANSAVKEDSPTEDSKKDIELVSKENYFGKQSSLFLATPMKQATHFDMKENPSSIKRETQGSMAAKSTTKRRALTEIQK